MKKVKVYIPKEECSVKECGVHVVDGEKYELYGVSVILKINKYVFTKNDFIPQSGNLVIEAVKFVKNEFLSDLEDKRRKNAISDSEYRYIKEHSVVQGKYALEIGEDKVYRGYTQYMIVVLVAKAIRKNVCER